MESPFPLKTSLKVHNKTVDLLSSSGAAEAAAAEKQRVKITRVTKRCHQVHPRLSKVWHCLISCVCFKAARRHCLLCLPDTSDVNVATRLSRETPAKKKKKSFEDQKSYCFFVVTLKKNNNVGLMWWWTTDVFQSFKFYIFNISEWKSANTKQR